MSSHLPRALLAALALEALMGMGAAAYLSNKTTSASRQQQVVMLSVTAPPVAKPEPPKPQEKPKLPPPPKPVHRPQPSPVQKPIIEQATPLSQAASIPAPPKPVQPQAADNAPSVSDVFKATVREAVQSAMRYPYSAQMAHIVGRTQVSFSYLDGAITNPRVLTSSGYSMLDDAAIEAVRNATYPSPPTNLVGKKTQFLVWVRFYQFENN